jgi:hypothetical protein
MNSVVEMINRIIKDQFIPHLVGRLSLAENITVNDAQRIFDEWSNSSSPKIKIAEKINEKVTSHELDANSLSNLKIPQLKQMCEARKLAQTGTKSTLIDRLCGAQGAVPTNGGALPILTKQPVKKNTTKKVIKQVLENVDEITLDKYTDNNYIHKETGFIFDDTKQVIGFEDEHGHPRQLNPAKLDECKFRNLPYKLPETILDQED